MTRFLRISSAVLLSNFFLFFPFHLQSETKRGPYCVRVLQRTALSKDPQKWLPSALESLLKVKPDLLPSVLQTIKSALEDPSSEKLSNSEKERLVESVAKRIRGNEIQIPLSKTAEEKKVLEHSLLYLKDLFNLLKDRSKGISSPPKTNHSQAAKKNPTKTLKEDSSIELKELLQHLGKNAMEAAYAAAARGSWYQFSEAKNNLDDEFERPLSWKEFMAFDSNHRLQKIAPSWWKESLKSQRELEEWIAQNYVDLLNSSPKIAYKDPSIRQWTATPEWSSRLKLFEEAVMNWKASKLHASVLATFILKAYFDISFLYEGNSTMASTPGNQMRLEVLERSAERLVKALMRLSIEWSHQEAVDLKFPRLFGRPPSAQTAEELEQITRDLFTH